MHVTICLVGVSGCRHETRMHGSMTRSDSDEHALSGVQSAVAHCCCPLEAYEVLTCLVEVLAGRTHDSAARQTTYQAATPSPRHDAEVLLAHKPFPLPTSTPDERGSRARARRFSMASARSPAQPACIIHSSGETTSRVARPTSCHAASQMWPIYQIRQPTRARRGVIPGLRVRAHRFNKPKRVVVVPAWHNPRERSRSSRLPRTSRAPAGLRGVNRAGPLPRTLPYIHCSCRTVAQAQG
ncbi:hypothetical protein BV20DRAFT_110639 [Pilatotrama ljubarskyi]|nr:hypothetical protein BV20DRAFT_110639 [Pilatotrama ljubarskyi]